mgnify:CR=1 FL=1
MSTPGALRVSREDGVLVEMPLRHTKVSIEVTAFVARSTIEQVFANPFTDPVEAVYTFPLGDRAAVDDFELVVGDRTIRGTIKRREEARATYEQARAAGYQAALLEQERPNVFTQSVANLEPGKAITVRLRTVETLRYERGVYRLTFPLVVGPPLHPRRIGRRCGADHARRFSPRARARARRRDRRDDRRRRPARRDSKARATGRSSNKTVASGATVRLADDDAIPNKGLPAPLERRLREARAGLLAHRDGLDGFFTLLVQPKGDVGPTEAMPKEITFVVDTSGSMNGIPIEASKRFAAKRSQALGPRDTFNLIRFAGDNEVYSKDPLPNDRAAIGIGDRLAEPAAGCGRHRAARGDQVGVCASRRSEPPARRRLPDRRVRRKRRGDPAAIGKILGDARIYTVGIGSSVNHYLLDRMADLGRGAYVFVRPDESAGRRPRGVPVVGHAPVSDRSLDRLGRAPVADLAPERLPRSGIGADADRRRPLPERGRGRRRRCAARSASRFFEQSLHVVLPEREAENAALSSLWARGRIEKLLRVPGEPIPDSVTAEVTALALTYRLDEPVHVVRRGGRLARRQPLRDVAHRSPGDAASRGRVGSPGSSARTAPRRCGRSDALDALPEDSGDAGELTREGQGRRRGWRRRRRRRRRVVGGVPVAAPRPAPAENRRADVHRPTSSRTSSSRAESHDRSRQNAEDHHVLGGVHARISRRGALLPERARPRAGCAGREEGREPERPGRARAQSSRAMPEPRERGERLLDVAFRLLADLADDGKLSAAEGRPALAALLAAQRGSGAIAG